MNFIDIHTHKVKNDADQEIINIFIQDITEDTLLPTCTVGFHPWHLDDHDERTMINYLHDLCEQPQIIAIGECGIDLTIAVDLEKQERIFLKQAGIAENKQKPLIIHCVKAYNEIIRLQKSINANMPWILHGYAARPQITKQLLKHNFYFSFGESLLKEKPKAIESFKIIPPEKIFFETDECEVSVSEIYSFAAKILNTDLDSLKTQIFNNYKQVFNNG